jgi:hypothetical protein
LFCCETEALGEDALDDADDDEDEDEDDDVEEDEMDMWLYLRLTDELSHNAIECRRCTFSAEYCARSFTTEMTKEESSKTSIEKLTEKRYQFVFFRKTQINSFMQIF